MHNLRRLWVPAVYVVLSLLTIVAGVAAVGQIQAARGGWAIAPLGYSALAALVQVGVLGVAWYWLLVRTAGPGTTPATGARTFLMGWLSRYLPGPPAGPAGKLLICKSEGIPLGVVGTALFYEQMIQLASMVAVPALTVGFLSGPGSALAALAGGLVALFAICLLVRPDSFRHIARVVTRFGFKHAAAVEPVPLASLVPPFAFMVAAGLLAAFSFHIVAWTMTPWKFGDAGHAVAIFSIAALAGYLVPFVPSGAGIREAVIVALMAPFIGPAGALSVAIVARAVAVLVDVLVAALLGATYAGRFAFNRRIAI